MEKKTEKKVEKKGDSKRIDKNTVVLKTEENVGAVQIADDVVAMIAALATMEVEGVCGMAGNIPNELMSKVGMKNLTKGVKVDILEGNVTIDLAVTMEYGYNIPVTCQQVQTKVKNAVENMTGLCCSDVNIRIAGVSMKK
ncbi:MAG: Asp23/Gls24 family envelope stress response protein [Roseburia sp.]|nr:Asp23/Gls24 family envelope stress response protein [Roseburia sp.]